eukprot:m51a1_g12344 hypothetical protein (170) ;mRNA; r:518062-518685
MESTWTLALKAGSSQSSEIPEFCTLRLEQVTLAGTKDEKQSAHLNVTVNDKKFHLATLVHGRIPQHKLALVFEAGEKVEFECQGAGELHLFGALREDAEDEDFDFDDDEAEEGDEDDEEMEGEDDEDEMEEEEEEEKPQPPKKAQQQQPKKQQQQQGKKPQQAQQPKKK